MTAVDVQPDEDRVYISLNVEINGEQSSITREVLVCWPGRDIDPRILLQEVFTEMDGMLAIRESNAVES
jgi:hypothetical protein